MSPDDILLHRVCATFRKTGRWPLYRDLELEFRKYESLEHVIALVKPGLLRIVGGADQDEVLFASLESYAAACKGSDDLRRVAQAAAFLGRRKLEGVERVTAVEIGEALGIKKLRLWRVMRLLDQDSRNLTSGGSRGSTVESWEYRLSDYSIYFADVTSYDEMQIARERVDDIQKLRRMRDMPFSWQGGKSDRPALPPISLPELHSLEYNVHPAISQIATPFLQSGHTNEAVRNAAARLESFLQDALGDFHSPAGSMVTAALGGKEPRIRLSRLASASDENEQKGFMHLALGTVHAVRNVLSHGTCHQMPMDEAIERLVLISMIFKRLDRAAAMQHAENDVSGHASAQDAAHS